MKWGATVLCYTLLAGATVLLWVSDEGVWDMAILAFPATLTVAALLLGGRRYAVFSVLLVGCVAGVLVAGIRSDPAPGSGWRPSARTLVDAVVVLGFTSLMMGLLSRNMRDGFNRSRQKEDELARANEALEQQAGRARLSEERYRAIIEQAVDGILLGDADGRIIGANSRAVELTGYSREALVGMNIDRLFSEEELRRAPLRYDLLREGKNVITERVMTRADGQAVPIEMNSKMMPDGTYQAFVRDVSARVLVDKALRKSEERYRMLFNNGMDAAFLHAGPRNGLPGRIVEVNDAACERLGYSRSELLRMNPLDIDAADTLPGVPRMMERLVRDGRADWEGVHLTKDGRRIPVEIRAQMFEIDGEPRVLSIARDLSERKRAAEAIRKSEQSYRQIFNATNDAIFVHDRDTGEVVDVNDAMLAMYGYTREEAIGLDAQAASAGKPPYSREDAMCWVRKAAAEGPQVFEWYSRRKNGELFWTEVALRCANIGGQGRVLAVVRDITERKRAEEERSRLEQQLRQAQKMQAIGQLAGGISHDFSNLLTIISGYAELALASVAPDHPAVRPLRQVMAAGERARDLTRQILAFGRRQSLMRRVINLSTELPAMEEMIRRLIGENIEVTTRMAPGLGNVMADASQIQQVLLNLAVNARDAMPEGGKLLIEASDIVLRESVAATPEDIRPGAYVLLTVSDTGCGMDQETLSRIFEPFFTTKPFGKGTGLGLATAFGIVRQHGGHICVCSEPGKGTTFRVYLPRVDAEPTARVTVASATSVSPTASETILLVEDEVTLRELMLRVLGERGYRVLEARSPTEAQRLAAEHRGAIDLLLTDVVMPGMSGPELRERLASSQPCMKVLYVSGYADGAFGGIACGPRSGAFLAKPFRIQTLLEKVREAIGSTEEGGE